MATCTICGGAGQHIGGYRPCYRCGGSGRSGLDTRDACMTCGGSGRGTEREVSICTHCSGSGRVADPPKPPPAASRTPPTPGRAAASMDGGWNWISTLVALAAAGLTFLYLAVNRTFEGDAEWLGFAAAGAAGLLAGALWRVVLKLGLAALAFILAHTYATHNLVLAEEWQRMAIAAAASGIAVWQWKLLGVLLVAAAGFALMVIVQDGMPPEDILNSIGTFLGLR